MLCQGGHREVRVFCHTPFARDQTILQNITHIDTLYSRSILFLISQPKKATKIAQILFLQSVQIQIRYLGDALGNVSVAAIIIIYHCFFLSGLLFFCWIHSLLLLLFPNFVYFKAMSAVGVVSTARCPFRHTVSFAESVRFGAIINVCIFLNDTMEPSKKKTHIIRICLHKKCCAFFFQNSIERRALKCSCVLFFSFFS